MDIWINSPSNYMVSGNKNEEIAMSLNHASLFAESTAIKQMFEPISLLLDLITPRKSVEYDNFTKQNIIETCV